MPPVYLDHNATSPLREEVREHWDATLRLGLGNASSVHEAGRRARQVLDEARERIANALGVHEDEVLFTSGGTESDNLALLGVLQPLGSEAGLVTSQIEHAAILQTADALERAGHPVARVAVDDRGLPDLEELFNAAAQDSTQLVSLMAVNNEVGSRPNLPAIAQALHKLERTSPLLIHTDAVQALGRIPIDLHAWGVDLASFSAHKVGGPLGVGVLVRRKGLKLQPRIYGGEHEAGLRAGTENVPAISAAALAFELATSEQSENANRWAALGELFWSQVQAHFPEVRLLGPPLGSEERAHNTLNVWIPGIDGRVLVTRLDLAGLQVSAGSACASGSLEPSHVLLAMGLDEDAARSGLRVSFGANTSEQDVHEAAQILSATLHSAR